MREGSHNSDGGNRLREAAVHVGSKFRAQLLRGALPKPILHVSNGVKEREIDAKLQSKNDNSQTVEDYANCRSYQLPTLLA